MRAMAAPVSDRGNGVRNVIVGCRVKIDTAGVLRTRGFCPCGRDLDLTIRSDAGVAPS